MTQATEPAFSMREARSLLSDEDLRPNLAHYWGDFLASYAGLLGGMLVMRFAELPLAARVGGFVLAVLLGYRSALFIHELMHQPEKEFRAFRFVWNLLVGIPFLIPTFVYTTHLDHHRRRHYGTSHDGEYLPFGTRPVWHALGYLAESFLIPILAVVRFGLLTPLTWLGKPIRDWVHRHASSMIIDPLYLRPLPSERQLRLIRVQEAACFGFLVVASIMVVRGVMGVGVLDPWFLPRVYAVAVSVILLNAVRTLVAHRYLYDRRAENDRPMSFAEQLLDSLNFPSRPLLTTLWAPVGLQFHGLHHLFPSLPYHATRSVHSRLVAGLPPDNLYHQMTSPGLPHALGDLWRRASESGKPEAPSEAEPASPSHHDAA